jgi:hypothetical protein
MGPDGTRMGPDGVSAICYGHGSFHLATMGPGIDTERARRSSAAEIAKYGRGWEKPSRAQLHHSVTYGSSRSFPGASED